MSLKKYVCMLFSLTLATMSLPTSDIEVAKATILAILHQKNPAVLAEFNDFYKRYYQTVVTFLDADNNEPLATHIKRMEGELAVLKTVCKRADFQPVQHILHTYSTEVSALITLLKKYVHSKNTLSLSLKIQHFSFLLPPSVRNRGNLALFKALHHRLRC